jgi:hypothetical protein
MRDTLLILAIMGGFVAFLTIAFGTALARMMGVMERLAGQFNETIAAVSKSAVEGSTEAAKSVAGVYAPDSGSGQASSLTLRDTGSVGYEESAEVFDDSDPTDAFLQPERTDSHMEWFPEDNPFGIPGLKVEASRGQG